MTVVVVVTLSVIVAVMLLVVVGVVVIVVEAAVSRQVHTAPMKDDACEARLLSLDDLASAVDVALVVDCARLFFAAAATVIVLVVVTVVWWELVRSCSSGEQA